MILQDQVFRRRVILATDDSGAKQERLWRFQAGGSREQVCGQAASQKVSRGAGCKQQQEQERREI